MLDKRTLHVKVQEQCDCFAETDPLREMAALKSEADTEEGAVKWIALAVLHGINSNAKKITVRRSAEGEMSVIAKYRKSDLPSPGERIGGKIFDVVRDITHIEGQKGKTPVVIGVRDSSVEMQIKLSQDEKEEEVVLQFPK